MSESFISAKIKTKARIKRVVKKQCLKHKGNCNNIQCLELTQALNYGKTSQQQQLYMCKP